jgi:hypothetical protein
MGNVIEVRNCVVHAGGRVEKYSDPPRLRDAVKRLQDKKEDGDVSYVDIDDGLLILGTDIVEEAIDSSKKIIRHLYRHVDDAKARVQDETEGALAELPKNRETGRP